jgi:hypothetical protein
VLATAIPLLFVTACGDARPTSPDAAPDVTSGTETIIPQQAVLVEDESKEIEFTVPVVNSTAAPAVFGRPSCGCACTTTELPTDRLACGERMTLRLGARAEGRIGRQVFSCRWSDQLGRPWRAGVSVELHRPAAFVGTALFGRVTPGDTVERVVHVRQVWPLGQPAPAVPTFTTSDPALSASAGSAEPHETVDALASRRLPVTLTLRVPDRPGYTRATVSVREPSRVYPLEVEWRYEPSVRPEPTRLVFATRGRPRQVRFFAADGRPTAVLAARVEPPSLGTASVQPDGSVEVTPATGDGRPAFGYVRINTGRPDTPSLSIPVATLAAVE